MYEKKINIFNDSDRELVSNAFKYNICFFTIMIIIIMMLVFIKKECYYQNIISFIDENNANIIVNKENIDIIKNHNELLLNDLSIKYNIDNIKENDDYYLLKIHFDIGINSSQNIYKIYLNNEPLIKYIIRVIGGK